MTCNGICDTCDNVIRWRHDEEVDYGGIDSLLIADKKKYSIERPKPAYNYMCKLGVNNCSNDITECTGYMLSNREVKEEKENDTRKL